MTPLPPWLIDELERLREERERQRPALHIVEAPAPERWRERDEPPAAPAEPIVIDF